jgi:DNA repair protein RadA/Sms
MTAEGLTEIENPSGIFLAERQNSTIGSAIVPVLEGKRPILVEIQALTNPTPFGMPRRTANGVDFNRLLLISAVLSKRAGLRLGNQDIMLNVTGGLKVDEPAADLGIALAIASSYRDIPVEPRTVAAGEVGLGGELRNVPQLERRIEEAARLGFTRCVVPRTSARLNIRGVEVLPCATVREALRLAIPKTEQLPQ